MTYDNADRAGADELELLRNEARELGMPGEITYESAGLRPTSAEDMLARVKAREHDVRPARRRRFAVRAMAVAAAGAGIIVLTLSPWQSDPAAADSPPVLAYEFANAGNIANAPGQPARAELLSLAAAARNSPADPGTGDTQYVLTDNWFASLEATKAAELIPKRRESWFMPDGSLRIREQSGPALSPDGRGLTEQVPETRRNLVNETYPPGDATSSFVQGLDGSVTAVRTSLLDAAQCEVRTQSPARASCLFQEISGLYNQYVVPADVSATFWQILADEPSLRSLGTVKDRAGRPGVGISIIPPESPQFRRVLILSPRTGQLLGSEDILIKNDAEVNIKAPAIYSFTAVLESRFTSARGPARG